MAVPVKVNKISCPVTARVLEKIFILWDKSLTATSYVLERKADDGDYTVVYSGSDRSYVDNVSLGCNTLNYRVNAVNSEGSSGYVESEDIEIIYCEIDSKGLLYPYNFIVDFSQSQFDVLPDVKDTTEELIGIDGEYLIETLYEPRLFDIVANSQIVSIDERMKLISNLGKVFNCFKSSERLFRYNGKLYKAKLGEKPSIETYPNWITLELTLKAYYPYGYSETHILSDSGTAENSGDEEIYPIFKITGEAINPIITVNGVNYTLLYTLAETDTVTIDCENKTVVLNDTTNILNYWGTEFPIFSVGNNTINVSNGNLKTYWKDKYICL